MLANFRTMLPLAPISVPKTIHFKCLCSPIFCLKPFFRNIFLRTAAHLPALASQSEALKLKHPFLLSDICYKTLYAHGNIMITKFSFLSVAVLLFIFPPLKPRTLKHPNQIYANKRNSCVI